jgi:hypothetical protein
MLFRDPFRKSRKILFGGNHLMKADVIEGMQSWEIFEFNSDQTFQAKPKRQKNNQNDCQENQLIE